VSLLPSSAGKGESVGPRVTGLLNFLGSSTTPTVEKHWVTLSKSR